MICESLLQVCCVFTDRFFVEPTFASNMVDKEINAVDSEHKKPRSCNILLLSLRN